MSQGAVLGQGSQFATAAAVTLALCTLTGLAAGQSYF
jgi:hypothetical protein